MCGIALLLSGIRLDLTSLLLDSPSPPPLKAEPTTSTNHSNLEHHQPLLFSPDDLKAALRRRGPDSLTAKKLMLQSKASTSPGQRELLSAMDDENCANGESSSGLESGSVGELQFIGATLQLRGRSPVVQPFVDSSGNILVYNGEIFGGIDVGTDSNDGEILLQTLGKCCECRSSSGEHTDRCVSIENGRRSVPDVLSVIKGPWAMVYWQDSSRTLWFGRDAFGRRSLLVHWPTLKDPRFLLSSVSPFSSVEQSSGMEIDNSSSGLWEELSCGVYSIMMNASKLDGYLVGEARKHNWTHLMLTELIKWDRVSVEPQPKELQFSCGTTQMKEHNLHSASSDTGSFAAQNVLSALRKSLMVRTSLHANFQVFSHDDSEDEFVPVAILFSGGLDSMILAALLDECLDPRYGIDLLNVSFDGQSAPDRISARAGVQELRKIAPCRRWKLVEIDAELSKLTWELKHVMSLISPANTYMDLNIGIALWLAARGHGWVNKGSNNSNDDIQQRFIYKSKARIVLVGSGADEQCAGYGRHKTKYRSGSWLGLHKEMKLDMQRIWKRNMGRDDRCIADNGKEARFPFLDEDVVRTLLDIPLWEVANLDQPSGTGDKKILREVARMLGLCEAAIQPKRAIQFGTRIARESNRKNFGSNRAANQASAGSASINML